MLVQCLTLMMSYQGQKLEIRISKSETNPKSQTAILKRSCQADVPFFSVFVCVWNLLFGPLPFVSNFVLRISGF